MRVRISGIALAIGAILAAGESEAATLSGYLTADNGFYAYVSTSPSSIGTLVASGDNWYVPFSVAPYTLPNQTLYLNIEVVNQGGPGGFLGTFTLTGSNFQFANGTQTLNTNATNWSGGFNTNTDGTFVVSQPWVAPTSGVESFGVNSGGTLPWGPANSYQPIGSIDQGAYWIWPTDSYSLYNQCGYCVVDFSTTISYTGVSATPLPATLPLFVSGLGALGLLGWRRKRKAAAVAA